MHKPRVLLLAAILAISGCASLPPKVAEPQPNELGVISTQLKEINITLKNIKSYEQQLEIYKTILNILIDFNRTLDQGNFTQLTAHKAYLDEIVKTMKELATYSERAGEAAGKAIAEKCAETIAKLEATIKEIEESIKSRDDSRRVECENLKPAIYNLGQGSIVVFEDKNRSAVRIPIDGRDMFPDCINFDLTITGDVPLRYSCSISKEVPQKEVPAKDCINGPCTNVPADREDCHINKPKRDSPDIASLVLKPGYLGRLKTGDRITVQVAISDKKPTPGCKDNPNACRAIAYATRSFTMYELEDYRQKMKANRVEIRDINAFPLTNEETRDLFGPVIAELYYAVRLSVSNQTGVAKLINTGMIRADGRAIVEPHKDTNEPIYTVPITVVPQSLQHVYSIVDSTEPDQLRSRFFRGLEFTGALGTAIKALGTVTRATAYWGLFTGVAIPEAKKLWPDSVPTYRKNLVDYAMPDLLKVAANSQTGHKYLFFSKKEIETVVSDPRMYLPVQKASARDSANSTKQRQPSSHVISLAFDHLDIRFDNVTNVEVDTAKADLLRLIIEFSKYLDNEYKDSVNKNKDPKILKFLTGSVTEWSKLLPNDASKEDKESFDDLKKSIETAISGNNSMVSAKEALQILEKGKKYGQGALELDSKRLKALTGAYTKGEDISLYSKDLNDLSSDLQNSKRILAFSDSLRSDFESLNKLTNGSYTKDNVKVGLITPMQKLLASIHSALSSLKEIDSAQ